MEDSLYTVLDHLSYTLHINNKVFPTVFEVTNMPGPMILGRVQAKAMGYVQFPQIWQPHTLDTFKHTSTKWCMHKTPTAKTAETTPKTQLSVHKTIQKENHQNKANTPDYRTSTTKHQMGLRLHTAKW